MPSKPSLLLRWFSALLQQKNGVQLPSNLKRNGNFHTAVMRWMASMWQLHVLETLAPCTKTTKVSSLLYWRPYTFLWIDVGSDGSSNDASIYNGSKLNESWENNPFHLPEDKPLPGDDVPVPYFIIGNNALGINKTLMNPFSIRNIDCHERIFNYSLSRAWRVVENAFDILAHQFRVCWRPWTRDQRHTGKLIATCVILHNLIRLRYPVPHNNLMDQNQDVIPGAWLNEEYFGCLP